MRDIAKASALMGQAPANPIGSCFDAAAQQLLTNPPPGNPRLCHAIGIANMPGEEGQTMAHAWVEFDLWENGIKTRAALDPIWLVATPADHYRAQLQVEHVVVYTRDQMILHWTTRGYPGPWDPEIQTVIPP